MKGSKPGNISIVSDHQCGAAYAFTSLNGHTRTLYGIVRLADSDVCPSLAVRSFALCWNPNGYYRILTPIECLGGTWWVEVKVRFGCIPFETFRR